MKILKTVQKYYSYQSQGHCFAPAFDELAEATKLKWIEDFKEYLKQTDDSKSPQK